MNDEFKHLQRVCSRETALIKEKMRVTLEGQFPQSLYKPCLYAIGGNGKHLRPLLVLLAAQATGGVYKHAYNAAIATELVHNATLIHDDIMDHSAKRRRRKTLYKKYGISTAILAGDNLLVLAYEHLLKDCSETNVKKIVGLFSQMNQGICQGQSLDLEFEKRSLVTLEQYRGMIYKKTALFAETCCAIGASLHAAPQAHILAVSEYGKYLGMAFQIQDDYLDIVGSEGSFGKPIGQDLKEGKKTYLLLRALEKAIGKDDKEQCLKVTRHRGVGQDEIKKYKDLYTRLGVLADAKNEIQHFTEQAIDSLAILPEGEGKTLLSMLARFLLLRDH